jgi:DNA recombination protein RmuC
LLHARLGTLSGHLTRLGSALGSAVGRFNDTVGSYESSVLSAARRFDDLGVAETPVPQPGAVEAEVRPLRPTPGRAPTPAPVTGDLDHDLDHGHDHGLDRAEGDLRYG